MYTIRLYCNAKPRHARALVRVQRGRERRGAACECVCERTRQRHKVCVCVDLFEQKLITCLHGVVVVVVVAATAFDCICAAPLSSSHSLSLCVCLCLRTTRARRSLRVISQNVTTTRRASSTLVVAHPKASAHLAQLLLQLIFHKDKRNFKTFSFFFVCFCLFFLLSNNFALILRCVAFACSASSHVINKYTLYNKN